MWTIYKSDKQVLKKQKDSKATKADKRSEFCNKALFVSVHYIDRGLWTHECIDVK